jgi:hypothetical protein
LDLHAQPHNKQTIDFDIKLGQSLTNPIICESPPCLSKLLSISLSRPSTPHSEERNIDLQRRPQNPMAGGEVKGGEVRQNGQLSTIKQVLQTFF